MKNRLFITIIVLFITACSSGKTRTTGSFINLVPIDNTKIDIFTKKKPSYQFKEIGMIEVFARGKNANDNDILSEMKKQAFKMRSDGIYKIDIQRYNNSKSDLHATGMAIKRVACYKGDGNK